MKIRFHLPSFQIFFERWYFLFFGLLFLVATIAAFLVFSLTTVRQAPMDELGLQPNDAFNESLVSKINELLDVRAEYFGRLKKLPPAIKNPF